MAWRAFTQVQVLYLVAAISIHPFERGRQAGRMAGPIDKDNVFGTRLL